MPGMGQRFLGFLPDINPDGPSEVAPADGTTYRWEFFVYQLATMTIQGLTPDEIPVALRLKRHLMNGGSADVETEDASTNVYTVKMAPGTTPSLSGPDSSTYEYSFTASVFNTDPAVPLICEY